MAALQPSSASLNFRASSFWMRVDKKSEAFGLTFRGQNTEPLLAANIAAPDVCLLTCVCGYLIAWFFVLFWFQFMIFFRNSAEYFQPNFDL